MGQGNDNLERVNRTKPYRSEFDSPTAIVHKIARESVKANRRSERRNAAASRAAMVDSHAESLTV